MHIKIVAQWNAHRLSGFAPLSRDPGILMLGYAVIYLHYFYGILIVWAIFHINFDCRAIMMRRHRPQRMPEY